MSVIYQIVNTEPDPPSAHCDSLSPELDAIVMKAISKDPGQALPDAGTSSAQALAETWKKDQKAEEKRDQSDTERFQLLRTLPFFRDFPENELWEVLKISKWAKFKPDTALIKEGDHGDSFFILAGGYVRVTRGKKKLSVLTAGDCFGEMSYLAQGRAAPLGHGHHDLGLHRHEDPRRGPARRLALLPAPLRRALPQHPGRAPRERQPAARGDVVSLGSTLGSLSPGRGSAESNRTADLFVR